MFILYINDLPDCAMSANFGYADDYKIVCNDPSILNIDAKRSWSWCVKIFYASKCVKNKNSHCEGKCKS